MKLYWILTYLFASSFLYSFGQIETIYFDFETGLIHNGREQRHIQDSDTSNYYLSIEDYFINDTVTILANDSIIFNDIVNTERCYRTIKVGEVGKIEKIGLKINNSPFFYLAILENKYYLRIVYIKWRKTMGISYSKYKPICN